MAGMQQEFESPSMTRMYEAKYSKYIQILCQATMLQLFLTWSPASSQASGQRKPEAAQFSNNNEKKQQQTQKY